MADKDPYVRRQFILMGLFWLGGLVLLAKAAQLQLFPSEYRQKSEGITIDKQTVYASRGLIFDRHGQLMVFNTALYDLMCTFSQTDTGHMDIGKFCRLLEIDRAYFSENLKKDWRSGRFSRNVPFVFLKKISPEVFARFQEHLHEFPGFVPQVRINRGYTMPFAGNVIGYLNEVSPDDIGKKLTGAKRRIYAPGDYIGATGLEYAYEDSLRGRKGISFRLKDNLGRIVGKFKDGNLDTTAISGRDLITGLDIELQGLGERLMSGKTGAIVAIEPATGEILALVSSPTYDPNDMLINKDRGAILKKMFADPLKPFFDRSVMAKYPPGSIFKTVVGLSAMQLGNWTPENGVGCNRGYYYNGRLYGCHGHPYAGNITTGVAHSCNAYFFTALRAIVERHGFSQARKGLTDFDFYCTKFGLGHRLGVDFPNESAGNIPTPKVYDGMYPNKDWRSTTIMSIGIGQGEIQLTTLQMANLAAIIANRGYFIPPHLVKGFIVNQDGRDTLTASPVFSKQSWTDVDTKYFEPVVEGMEGCVNYGTARIAAVPGIAVCGKTGTSQNPHGEDHSVFFAFAPKYNPKIAIAVYVENAGWGASYAAPIASLMIEKYLNGDISPQRKYLEERMVKTQVGPLTKALVLGVTKKDSTFKQTEIKVIFPSDSIQ